MVKTAIGKSHAKIILIGEHSAVYGEPAIVLPLSSVVTTVTIKSNSSNGQWLDCRYYSGPIQRLSDNMQGIRTLIETLLTRFDAQTTSFKMHIESELPAERGMGSSAATAVAIIRAMYQYFDRPLTRSQLLADADIEETITHGNPSGMDAATTSSDVPIWFVNDRHLKEIIQIPITLSSYLVIADSGIKGKTGQAVKHVAEQKMTSPEKTDQHLQRLGQLANEAKEAVASDNSRDLGQMMTEAQWELNQLNVSSPELDRLITTAMATGALGAKLTGGGLGGCMIALCADEEKALQVSDALLATGATRTWIESFNFEEEKTQ
ncbi:mevalonate kinase [Levilactobacillus bambusae]|uniref:Mevalonate kinase n=2 Tax=Levilactobacillus bambusae TaxID=2024736 RepID=A0A2V1N1P1_9LACO|nr:mevalonate kinase [Levilactobacillus bambusae]